MVTTLMRKEGKLIREKESYNSAEEALKRLDRPSTIKYSNASP